MTMNQATMAQDTFGNVWWQYILEDWAKLNNYEIEHNEDGTHSVIHADEVVTNILRFPDGTIESADVMVPGSVGNITAVLANGSDGANATISLGDYILNPIAQALVHNSVQNFKYETSNDSDGGVKASAANFSSSMGNLPTESLCVLEADAINLYDLTQPTVPLIKSWVVAGATSVGIINGVIVYGSATGLYKIDLVNDDVLRYDSVNLSRSNQNAADFDQSTSTWSVVSVAPIVNSDVRSVVATTLTDAPINQTTGLKEITVYAGTEGGLTVINDDGTIAVAPSLLTRVFRVSEFGGHLFAANTNNASPSNQGRLSVLNKNRAASFIGNYGSIGTNPGGIPLLPTNAWGKMIDNNIVTNSGVIKLYTDYETIIKSMYSQVTSVFNTGIIQGECEVCLTGEDLTDKARPDTVINDAGAATFAPVNGGDLQATTAVGGDITAAVTTGGECDGWELIGSVWLYRRAIADWVGVSEAGGTLTIATGTVFTLLRYVNGVGKAATQLDFTYEQEYPLFESAALSLISATQGKDIDHNHGSMIYGIETATAMDYLQGILVVNKGVALTSTDDLGFDRVTTNGVTDVRVSVSEKSVRASTVSTSAILRVLRQLDILSGRIYTKGDGELYYLSDPTADEKQIHASIQSDLTLLPAFSVSRSSGTDYLMGFYHALPTSDTLTQASPSVTHGDANEAAGARAFICAGGAGSVDTGVVSLVVSGDSIGEDGVQVLSDSEVLVADITTLTLNQMLQTAKKWNGIVTYTLTPVGGASVYSLSMNHGHCRFEDVGDRNVVFREMNAIGVGGNTDTTYDLEIIIHKLTGWTYHATAFVPGPTPIMSLIGDYGSNNKVYSGSAISWARKGDEIIVKGKEGEGFVIRERTGSPNTISHLMMTLGVTIL